MKRNLVNFSIFISLLFLFSSYLSYYQFEFILPRDLFRYPYSDLSKTEVDILKFTLKWLVPGVIVILFMWRTKIHNRVTNNWGIIILNITIIIFLVRFPIFYLASLVPGGGALFVSKIYLSYLNILINIGLLIGTLKIFLTLQPLDNDNFA